MNEVQTYAVPTLTPGLPWFGCIEPAVSAGEAISALSAALTGVDATGAAPKGAKTVLRVYNGSLVADVCNNNKVSHSNALMPDIVDVSIIETNGIKKVVFVEFADGTAQKAVLSNNDTFSLEQGISICIAKKLFDMKAGNGSSLYNKIIDRGVKVYKKSVKMAEKNAAEESAKKEKYKKLVAKKQAKRMKREAAEREHQIEIQKEAYLRAMHEFHTRSAD